MVQGKKQLREKVENMIGEQMLRDILDYVLAENLRFGVKRGRGSLSKRVC